MYSDLSLLRLYFFTDSIVKSATRRYLSYSKADFKVFQPAGVTHCTNAGEIWHGEGDQRPPPPRQISPPSVQRLGYIIIIIEWRVLDWT